MVEIKYTNDGKKVVVVGKLNSQETIVQEVFIIGDTELPSGENFVVKSLHDEPTISWKESRINEIDRLYELTYKEKETKYNQLKKEMNLESSILRQKISYIKTVVKNIKPESFDLMCDYISGEITHILYRSDYISDCKILTMKEFNEEYEGKLRLISIFGRDDGTLNYAIGQYYDYSGSNAKFIPFKSYEEARLALEERLSIENICERVIELAKKHDIKLDSEKLKGYKDKCLENYNKEIENLNSSIQKVLLKKDKILLDN